jgi:hypothetical protein
MFAFPPIHIHRERQPKSSQFPQASPGFLSMHHCPDPATSACRMSESLTRAIWVAGQLALQMLSRNKKGAAVSGAHSTRVF